MTESNTAGDTPKALWRAIRITTIAMAVMSGIFMLAALIISEVAGPLRPEANKYKKWILPALALVAFMFFLIARFSYQKEITRARETGLSLVDKLSYYRSAVIKYLAVVEGIVIFGSIIFLFTADFSYLVFSAVVIGFMAANLPRKNKVAELLQLDNLQTAELDNG